MRIPAHLLFISSCALWVRMHDINQLSILSAGKGLAKQMHLVYRCEEGFLDGRCWLKTQS
jgi:hypothetical protein